MTTIDPAEIVLEEPEAYDWPALVGDLNALLRLKTTPIGMKLFRSVDEMAAIPRIRRPNGAIHTTDQIVAQAARLGWTVGITVDDLSGTQCSAVIGLTPRDEKFLAGKNYAGVWYETPEDAAAHQAAMDLAPSGFEAMAVSPLTSGRLDPPDICLIYATPGQMIILINGLQWSGYRKFEWSVVGESACADSWGRALKTGEPSLAIPCYAERRYGGVLDDELLMALPPKYLPRAINGMKRISQNGLRYPIPQYGIQQDARAGLAVSYGNR
ncbi:DUF169 domain-containing protein [bacterium]|jgi:uncharacterized protein (DUF169 family)|nr:DUF169 domain-containing protein [bacterium]